MANYKRPGTYVEETLLPQQIESQGTATAVGAFLGTSDRGPLTATLVSSWSEFVRLFGSFNVNHNLHFAVYSFFSNGGRAAYVARVLGTGATKASVTLLDRAGSALNTLTVTALNEGTWANSSNATTGLSVEVIDNGSANRFDLVVYQGGAASPSALNVVERFNDLSMDDNDPRYVERQINGLSAYISVVDLDSATTAPSDRPAASGTKTFSGGGDGSAPVAASYTAALTYGGAGAAFDTISNSLILNIPDVQRVDDSTAIAVLQAAGLYADARGDVFLICDTNGTPQNATGAISWATAVSSGAATSGANMALYYPWITIPDPTGSPGTTRSIAPGGAMVGLYLSTDALQGPHKSPAGLNVRVNNAVAPSVRLSNSDLDALNVATVPVNAIRSIPGAGVCVMGARTMRTTYSDRYIGVRRSMIYLKKSLTEATQFAIFESNDERLWERLRTVCNTILQNFWQTGGLRGLTADQAWFVKCDSTNNTAAVIQNGEVRIEIGVALQTPAEFVVIRIGQFQGGTSVSV